MTLGNTTIIPITGLTVPIIKTITALVMLVAALIGVYVPIFVVDHFKKKYGQTSLSNGFQKWLGRLSCFAGGVFLSTGFMDILPDVIETVSEAAKTLNINQSFPLSSFFILSGFFLVLIIEQTIIIYKHHKREKRKTDMEPENPSLRGHDNFVINEEPNAHVDFDLRSASCHDDEGLLGVMDRRQEEEDTCPGQEDMENVLHDSGGRLVALMCAMSVHAVFEGLAVGLAVSAEDVGRLSAVLGMHKLIVAASLGLSLAGDSAPSSQSGNSEKGLWTKLGLGFIFAVACPLGVSIGIAVLLGPQSPSLQLVAGVLQGLACGTFFYVVFIEILPHELGHEAHSDRPAKLIALILGFCLVCTYLLIFPEPGK